MFTGTAQELAIDCSCCPLFRTHSHESHIPPDNKRGACMAHPGAEDETDHGCALSTLITPDGTPAGGRGWLEGDAKAHRLLNAHGVIHCMRRQVLLSPLSGHKDPNGPHSPVKKKTNHKWHHLMPGCVKGVPVGAGVFPSLRLSSGVRPRAGTYWILWEMVTPASAGPDHHTGTDCPEALWFLHSWTHSKLNWTEPWATSSNWSCSEQGTS